MKHVRSSCLNNNHAIYDLICTIMLCYAINNAIAFNYYNFIMQKEALIESCLLARTKIDMITCTDKRKQNVD